MPHNPENTAGLANSFKNAGGTGAAYEQYRSRYPTKAIGKIFTDFGIPPKSVFADIAAGTGFLSFVLASDNIVYHIDPSTEMNRVARAKRDDLRNPLLQSRLPIMEARAEKTTLRDRAVDAIVLGNASHWLVGDNYAASLKELNRISKPDAKIVVANNMVTVTEPSMKELFKDMKTYFPSYDPFDEHEKNAMMFIDNEQGEMKRHYQIDEWLLTREQFIGYISTLSYALKDGFAEGSDARRYIEKLFDDNAKGPADDRKITLLVTTDMFCGPLLSHHKIKTPPEIAH